MLALATEIAARAARERAIVHQMRKQQAAELVEHTQILNFQSMMQKENRFYDKF